MREIDRCRLMAMTEIMDKGSSFLFLSSEYKRTYKDGTFSGTEKIEMLDELWNLIVEHSIRLKELIRENSL